MKVMITCLLSVFVLLIAVNTTPSSGCNDLSIASNGSDVVSCLNSSSSSCKTLDYVVQNLPLNASCISMKVYDSQNLSIPWNITAVNFTMQGVGDVSLDCQNSNAVITISNTSNTLIMGIEIINCGIIGAGAGHKPFSIAGVTVYNCTNLTITNCAFRNSSSTALAIIDDAKESEARQFFINGTIFSANTNNMMDYQGHNVGYNNGDHFMYNGRNLSRGEEGGGGLMIDLRSHEAQTTIILTFCSFHDNLAWIGGGAYINMNSFTDSTIVDVSHCQFAHNKAGLLGGGLFIGNSDPLHRATNPRALNINIHMDNVKFDSNIAPHAGGLAYETMAQWLNVTTAMTSIINTIFVKNVATYSGAAFGLFKWDTDIGGIATTIDFVNCSWENNEIYRTFTENSTIAGLGVLYTEGIPFSLKGSTLITRNYGTAILASSAEIYMYDDIMLSYNSGTRGGAMNLVSNSRMIVQSGLNLTFAYNYADLAGGAIYHVFPVVGVTGQNHYCVFMYHQFDIVDPTKWDANITFIHNTALISGSSLFLSSSDSCHLNSKNEIFTENSTFHFFPNYTKQVTSSPIQILFSSPSINCSNYSNCWTEVMLGEKLTLTLTAIDVFGNSVKGFAAVDIDCIKTDGNLTSIDECDYRIMGNNLVEFEGTSQQVPFYIAGPRKSNYSDHVLLTWQLMELPSAIGYLHVIIKDCYLGYIFDEEKQICYCYNKTETGIMCMDTNYTACVRFGHWYGLFTPDNDGQNTTDTREYATADCSFGSCDYRVSGECPNESCGPEGSPYQFYCKLPRVESNSLCLFNKGGVLCSGCREGFAPTFPDSLRCVSKDSCHGMYAVIQALLYLLYLIVATLLVLLVVKFNLRIGSGQVYGLVFYFSVFKYFVGGVFPSEFLYGIEIFFTGIVQFNPAIIGMIPICSKIEMDTFLGVFIQLVNPAFLALTILIILFVSRKWPRYSILPTTNLGINAICVMLYLCFISITQTTLRLLNPLTLPAVRGVYTFLDPTKHYFGSDHWPYGVISLLLQLVLVLPFLCLLLFSPFLIRFRRLNLTRIKPILDEFQACYKTEYRYFAGFYLTCRQLIFLMSFINLGAFAYIFILQFLSIFILSLHLMVQPYKSKRLNVLDGLLILDLVCLSLLHGNTAAVVFDDFVVLKIVLIYMLVLLPVLYFLLLCIQPVLKYCVPLMKSLQLKYNKFQLRRQSYLESANRTGYIIDRSTIRTTVVTPDSSDDDNDDEMKRGLRLGGRSPSDYAALEREPLLFDDHNNSPVEHDMRPVASSIWKG